MMPQPRVIASQPAESGRAKQSPEHKKSWFAVTLLFIFLVNATTAHASDQCYGLYRNDPAEKMGYAVKPCVMLLFYDLQDDIDVSLLNNIWAGGAVPMLTLEPWKAQLDEIAQGRYDDRLKATAERLKEFGHPVFIRFAHEMNGNWYPWGASSDYIAAYRHVHDVIGRQAIWVWSVNAADVPATKENRAENYYPGNGYVDAIGIDGYNMSAIPLKTGWKFMDSSYAWLANRFWGKKMNFDAIFGGMFERVSKAFPSKPMLITEVATSLTGESRQAWMQDFFGLLKGKYKNVPLFIWFDTNKETDWRIALDRTTLDIFNYNIKDFDMGREKLISIFGEQL